VGRILIDLDSFRDLREGRIAEETFTERRDALLDWMALVVSDFTEKPGFHIMLKGKQGTGKNMLMRPLVNYLQPDHQATINSSLIESGFTKFLTQRLVSVDELKMTTRGSNTPHDNYTRVKGWTARDADLIQVNDKNTKHYQAADRSAWVITSNEAVPLPLEEDDRRFMVIETPAVPWAKKRDKAIAKWLEAGGSRW
jgi:putative DNA primase/helicase